MKNKYEINNEILEENPFISKRLLIIEREKRLFEQSRFSKPRKKLVRQVSKRVGYVKTKSKTESWKIKALKEFNKPIKPKQDKDYQIKKIFGDNCEIRIVPSQERLIKHLKNLRVVK